MTSRSKTIESWHIRALAYEKLTQNYRIFTDMCMGLIDFVIAHQNISPNDMNVLDLAAGSGLVSSILLEKLKINSLYLVEPAEAMLQLAIENLHKKYGTNLPKLYPLKISAEDCLTSTDLPHHYFTFILCNASMHLMSEKEIFPIITKLLKPNGYFLYTLWYHSYADTVHFEETNHLNISRSYINQALLNCNYPIYFHDNGKKLKYDTHARTKADIEQQANINGLYLHSCDVTMHQTPVSFDVDFAAMTDNWLIEHIEQYRTSSTLEDSHTIRKNIIECAKSLMKDTFIQIPTVRIIIGKMSNYLRY